MIIVTGGAGFIGSNLIAGLNRKGIDDILVVDSLQNGHKFRNLRGLQLSDYVDKEDFLGLLDAGGLGGKRIDAVFHQGACTDTMEWDGRYMLNNNYEFSKKVLLFCSPGKIPFIYASSASVYGKGDGGFREDPNGGNEYPLNVYAYSKHLFDSWVLRRMGGSGHQVAGLRYFNVFGPNEMHKGRMASMVYQVYRQIEERGYVELFKGADGVPDGGQKRDFVYVEDVVRVNLFLFEHREVSGIFNCGTGQARSFNDVAGILISLMGKGETRYIPFPEALKDTYQSFTEADISSLRRAGYDEPFNPLEDSLECYLHILQGNGGYLF